MNLDLLKKGTIADIAAIVRCLYNRSKVKELPILERKLYDQAKKLLEDEISIAMGIDVKEIESQIHTKLEPPGSTPKVKHIIDEFDDEDDDLMNDVSDSSGKENKDRDDDDEVEYFDFEADDNDPNYREIYAGYDTIENRFLKYAIREMALRFAVVKEHIMTAMHLDDPKRIDTSLEDMENELMQLSNNAFSFCFFRCPRLMRTSFNR